MATRVCTQCGNGLGNDDKFCGGCGAAFAVSHDTTTDSREGSAGGDQINATVEAAPITESREQEAVGSPPKVTFESMMAARDEGTRGSLHRNANPPLAAMPQH